MTFIAYPTDNISVIRVSDFTFRARWSEVTRAISGQVLSQDRYWGEFTYRLHPTEKQDPEERDGNPLAMKIEQITWAKE
jgi:type IV secretory pathway TrbF-like protein